MPDLAQRPMKHPEKEGRGETDTDRQIHSTDARREKQQRERLKLPQLQKQTFTEKDRDTGRHPESGKLQQQRGAMGREAGRAGTRAAEVCAFSGSSGGC